MIGEHVAMLRQLKQRVPEWQVSFGSRIVVRLGRWWTKEPLVGDLDVRARSFRSCSGPIQCDCCAVDAAFDAYRQGRRCTLVWPPHRVCVRSSATDWIALLDIPRRGMEHLLLTLYVVRRLGYLPPNRFPFYEAIGSRRKAEQSHALDAREDARK